MNYLAHAVNYLERPVFAIGTSIPDWLSACDRRVRIRSKMLTPFLDDPDPFTRELAAGIAQHLADDDWFHQTNAFAMMNVTLSREFRKVLGPVDDPRPGFLAHVATELILDGLIDKVDPGRLDRYYELIEEIDVLKVMDTVNRFGKRESTNLANFIVLCGKHQFLRDYQTGEGLRMRLSGVCKRVGLPTLPESTAEAIGEMIPIVAAAAPALLANLDPLPL